MIFQRTMWPILGSIFHPTYMMVNAKILGQMTIDTEKCAGMPAIPRDVLSPTFDCVTAQTYLASFGMGSATMSIILLAPIMCFTMALNTLIP